MATATQSEDWRASIDINKEDWAFNVLKTCPGLNMTEEFLSTLKRIPTRWDFNAPYPTPDGRSLQAWHNDPLPSYLLDDTERTFYFEHWGFSDVMDFIQSPSAEEYRKAQDYDLSSWSGEDDAVDFANDLKKMRRNFTDEQLMRCLYEFWRHDCMGYVSDFIDVVERGKRFKEDIDELAEELATLHAEQTADFV